VRTEATDPAETRPASDRFERVLASAALLRPRHSSGEGEEEGVALGADLVTKRRSQDGTLVGQDRRMFVAQSSLEGSAGLG
jgi:hypothetical protein